MTVEHRVVLLTGGSGRLGTELKTLLPSIIAPTRKDMDITRLESVVAALDRYRPQVVVHAAAYTDVAAAERDHAECWRINVEGTRNMVRGIGRRPIYLVHISTDYVFEGTTGMYGEDEPLGPPRNYYALSKLVAEEVARMCSNHLVIRTSFRPREWPYPVAFTDVYTSQDYIDVIAPDIALAVTRVRDVPFSTVHIATHRKSVYELAISRQPDVVAGSKRDVPVVLPDDISLNVSRWERLKASWRERVGV